MSNLFIWIYSGGRGGVKFIKRYNGGEGYRSLGTAVLDEWNMVPTVEGHGYTYEFY
jgi:hypothetical protein